MKKVWTPAKQHKRPNMDSILKHGTVSPSRESFSPFRIYQSPLKHFVPKKWSQEKIGVGLQWEITVMDSQICFIILFSYARNIFDWRKNYISRMPARRKIKIRANISSKDIFCAIRNPLPPSHEKNVGLYLLQRLNISDPFQWWILETHKQGENYSCCTWKNRRQIMSQKRTNNPRTSKYVGKGRRPLGLDWTVLQGSISRSRFMQDWNDQSWSDSNLHRYP